MFRKHPYLPIAILGLAAAASLGLGVYLDQWIVGLGGAAAALCLIGLLGPVSRRFGSVAHEAYAASAESLGAAHMGQLLDTRAPMTLRLPGFW